MELLTCLWKLRPISLSLKCNTRLVVDVIQPKLVILIVRWRPPARPVAVRRSTTVRPRWWCCLCWSTSHSGCSSSSSACAPSSRFPGWSSCGWPSSSATSAASSTSWCTSGSVRGSRTSATRRRRRGPAPWRPLTIPLPSQRCHPKKLKFIFALVDVVETIWLKSLCMSYLSACFVCDCIPNLTIHAMIFGVLMVWNGNLLKDFALLSNNKAPSNLQTHFVRPILIPHMYCLKMDLDVYIEKWTRSLICCSQRTRYIQPYQIQCYKLSCIFKSIAPQVSKLLHNNHFTT